MKMSELSQTIGRRFARLTTNVVVSRPRLWRYFRPLTRKQFDLLAPTWHAMRSGDALAAYEAALTALPSPPRRALDLGTGTGLGAFAIARRFPSTEIVGADLSERMIAEARRQTPQEFRERISFEVADASKLPYRDADFDLVALVNMIPFFEELARVLQPGGHVLVSFSSGATTPIYVPFDRLRKELSRRGFVEFAEFEAAGATALLARKAATS
jgi:ubiquinone/menaquinone biosynthesis C-methylase UbiE